MTTIAPAQSAAAVPWWSELFGPEAGPGRRRGRVLRKGGQPFLILPATPKLAAAGLQLYPAQRFRARLVRAALVALLRTGLPTPGPVTELAWAAESPLARLLAELAGQTHPSMAILAGNPNTAGRRFIILVWKDDDTPAAVVKVGASENARRLIQQEEEFLRHIPDSVPGIPRVLESLRTETLAGFALPFVGGDSPSGVTPAVVQLLQGWLMPGRLVAARDVADWVRLNSVCQDQPGWAPLAAVVEAKPFTATVTHGDFTPWNVRGGGPERASALDWERGAFPGLPAWDWFHFVIQNAILVRRRRGSALARECERLLRQEAFRAYAVAAGLAGREREMLLAYLHHVIHVLRPSEGLAANQELLSTLLQTQRKSGRH